MILLVTKDNYKAEWDNNAGTFKGDKKLVDYLNKLISFNSRLGSNSYIALVEDAELYAITIEKFIPDPEIDGVYDL